MEVAGLCRTPYLVGTEAPASDDDAHAAVDMAAALLTAIPPLVVYFALGKFFVQGITAGAIKG